jgi:hypothetical protein
MHITSTATTDHTLYPLGGTPCPNSLSTVMFRSSALKCLLLALHFFFAYLFSSPRRFSSRAMGYPAGSHTPRHASPSVVERCRGMTRDLHRLRKSQVHPIALLPNPHPVQTKLRHSLSSWLSCSQIDDSCIPTWNVNLHQFATASTSKKFVYAHQISHTYPWPSHISTSSAVSGRDLSLPSSVG